MYTISPPAYVFFIAQFCGKFLHFLLFVPPTPARWKDSVFELKMFWSNQPLNIADVCLCHVGVCIYWLIFFCCDLNSKNRIMFKNSNCFSASSENFLRNHFLRSMECLLIAVDWVFVTSAPPGMLASWGKTLRLRRQSVFCSRKISWFFFLGEIDWIRVPNCQLINYLVSVFHRSSALTETGYSVSFIILWLSTQFGWWGSRRHD